MQTNPPPSPPLLNQFRRWALFGVALISFDAGSLLTSRLMSPALVRADDHRAFELLIYHAVPGKVPKLEARFSDAASLLAKHHIDVLGYWVPEGKPAWDNTFVYLLAAPSREEAKKNWDAFHADPAFQKYLKEEQAEQLILSVDSTYMRPTDFSPLK